ncbi:hypothetical protein DIPPA_23392 [Diplonema papillatum]|nr:hypothetical protein DIPPA_23392 [Diplonema papillatum]|eukprot:gene6304-9656_t
MQDDDAERKKKRRGPLVVPRKNTSVSQQTVHDVRKAAAEEEAARFVAAPRRVAPPTVVAMEGKSNPRSGASGARLLLSSAEKERTGFDVLQHSYDKDTYPTTLPEAGDNEEAPRVAGFLTVKHVQGDGEVIQDAERRFCAVAPCPTGLVFVHKTRAVRTEQGRSVALAHSNVILYPEQGVLDLISGSEVLTLTAETVQEAQSWHEALIKGAKEAEEDLVFQAYLEDTYGHGLDWLAEAEREEKRRGKNNLNLFPSLAEDEAFPDDELFLIQLPHILPSVKQQAKRTASSAGGSGGKSAQTSTHITHKPGYGWTGRALGSTEHPSSLTSLPPGRMGKIQVHKSGKIRLKIGECSFDISSGGDASYAQTLMAVYTVETKYKAEGWGNVGGCTIYSQPTLTAPTALRKVDGDIITVSRETSAPDGHFYSLGEAGWVLRDGPGAARWSLIGGDTRPRAYELGPILRKIVVTPDFDGFENDDAADLVY